MAKSPKRKAKSRAPAAANPARRLPTGTLAFAAIGLVGAGLAAFVAHRDSLNAVPATRAVALAVPATPEPIKTAAPAPAAVVAETEPAPAAAPPRMNAIQAAAFDAWLFEAYRKCWSAPAVAADGDPYIPKVRIALKADGALEAARLVNPPSDPATKPQAHAAMKAVRNCDPLRVPDKYAAYYPQWKTKTVYFAP